MTVKSVRFQFVFADAEHIFAIDDLGFLLRWPNSGGALSSAEPQAKLPLPMIGGVRPELVHAFAGGGGRIYLVNREGHLYLIRYEADALVFSGERIGEGWGECLHIVCDGEGVIYAVMGNGELRYYRDNDRSGRRNWDEHSSAPISPGWGRFRFVMSGGQGMLYAIDNAGAMFWFRHQIGSDGTQSLSPASGAQIGSAWHFFAHVFSGKPGEIYCIDVGEFGGRLIRYVDTARDGTSNGWQLPPPELVNLGWQCIPLEGYVWPPSAAPGERLQLRLSAVHQGTDCSVQIMRVIDIGNFEAIGPSHRVTLTYQRADSDAWQDGCRWASTLSFEVPSSAPSGLYVFRCTLSTGYHYDVPATVLSWLPGRPVSRSTANFFQQDIARGLTAFRPDGTTERRRREGDFAIIVNINTWCAYNTWGGYSNYSFIQPKRLSLQRPNHHLLVASRDHPRGDHLYRAEVQMHAWLAARGYRVDTLTDWDVGCAGFDFSGYRGVVLAGHPEYWSCEMIAKLQRYVASGGHVLYFGGNAMYRPVVPVADASAFETDMLDASSAYHWTHPFWQGVDRWLLGIRIGTLDSDTADRGYRVSLPDGADFSRRPYVFLRTAGGDWLAGNGDIVGAESGHRPACGWETEWAEAGDPAVVALAYDPAYPTRISMAYREVGAGWSFGVGSILFGQNLSVDTRMQQIIANVLDACLTS